MKQGKLTNEQLKNSVLNRLNLKNKETILGAGVGEDCCAVDFGDICVVSTDPVTAANANAGALAIHINANDIASAGAVPLAALVTLIIPTDCAKQRVDEVMTQLIETADSLGIDIIGGHTEVTDSVNRVIISVTMMGKPIIAGRVFQTADMRVGDALVMTKYAGMEGTAIAAADYAAELVDVLTDMDTPQLRYIETALSVVREGEYATRMDGVHAMHDVTEGGVVGAVAEMCEAAGVGARIWFSRIPVLDVTKKICNHYGMDVYGLISSGSMLISAADGEALVDMLAKHDIPATIIGEVTQDGLHNMDTGQPFCAQQADELYKVLVNAR